MPDIRFSRGTAVNSSILRRPTATTLSAFALAAALSACSGPYPPPPDSRIDPVTDVLHGGEITDNYRWLEDQDAAETREWIAAQNEYAELIV